jgi:polyferredoxin
MVWIRRISQTFFLLLFIFLLVESRLPQAIYVDYSAAFTHEQDLRLSQPVTFFFHLDPLVWLTSLLSGHAWIKGFAWGMGVLVLTLFLGRVFCGFICPFGTLHHAVSRFRPAVKGTRLVQATQKSSSQRFKYFLLVALLVSCLLGLNLTGLMDPIAFLFRSVTLAILPGVGVGIRTLFDLMAKSHIKDLNLLSYGAEVLVSPVFGYSYKAFQAGWLIGFLFLVILFLNRIRPRFWCRILCPLGALLGIFSRFSLLKLQKDPEKCTHCKLCTQTCQGGASPMPGQQWESAECLWCFNCFHACPEDALGFGLKWSPRVNKTPCGVGRPVGRHLPAPPGETRRPDIQDV